MGEVIQGVAISSRAETDFWWAVTGSNRRPSRCKSRHGRTRLLRLVRPISPVSRIWAKAGLRSNWSMSATTATADITNSRCHVR